MGVGCFQPYTCHQLQKRWTGDPVSQRNKASFLYKEVIRELGVQEANDAGVIPSLIADLSIRGVWQPRMVLFLTYSVIFT